MCENSYSSLLLHSWPTNSWAYSLLWKLSTFSFASKSKKRSNFRFPRTNSLIFISRLKKVKSWSGSSLMSLNSMGGSMTSCAKQNQGAFGIFIVSTTFKKPSSSKNSTQLLPLILFPPPSSILCMVGLNSWMNPWSPYRLFSLLSMSSIKTIHRYRSHISIFISPENIPYLRHLRKFKEYLSTFVFFKF